MLRATYLEREYASIVGKIEVLETLLEADSDLIELEEKESNEE